MRALPRLVLISCLLSAASAALSAEPRPRPDGDRPPRRDPESGGEDRRRDPDRKAGGGDDARRERRDIETNGGGTETKKDEARLELLWREGGCSIDGHRAFVKALLASENPSDAMSLEVWGDSHEYVPYQKVFYYLRVPRPAYVTLFWIGPKQDIFVPFQNLRIPPDRDVSVDPESIVVPPLGREQWVALASLEPIPLSCYTSETEHLSWLQRVKRLPHGVGRWEVRSKQTR